MVRKKKESSNSVSISRNREGTSVGSRQADLREELRTVAGIDARRDIVRIVFASALFIIGLFMSIAFLSNVITGLEDQSRVMEGGTFTAANKAGMLGAYCSYYFMNKLFGLAALILPFYFLCIAMKLILGKAARQLKIWALTIHCTAVILIISLDMAYISRWIPVAFTDRFSFYLGGMSGQEIVGMLDRYVGNTVTAVILGCITVLYLGYWFTQIFIWIFKGIHRIGRLIFGACDPEEEAPVVLSANANAAEVPAENSEEDSLNDMEPPCITIDLTEAPEDGPADISSMANESPVEPEGSNDECPQEDAADDQQKDFCRENVEMKAEDGNADDAEAIKMEVHTAGEEAKAGARTLEGTPVDAGLYNPKLDLSRYKYPGIELLKRHETPGSEIDMLEQNENKERIINVLRNFSVEIESIQATIGPTVTLYEIKPAQGVRIARIRNLEDDIALSLSALGIRIIAPIPGKGTIGIEVPNKKAKIVSMESVINTQKFRDTKYELPLALGRTITNEVFMVDLAKMPHLLVAGATGQGKSVGLNAIIASLLYKKHPAELKLVMIDPKKVEFSMYAPLVNHFLAQVPDCDEPVITDVKKVVATLKSLCQEMDDRYDLLKAAHCRNIKEYNDKFCHRRLNPERGHRYMPYIVVIIDEFGDLIMTAGKEVELPIARIAQLARAVGIHMIIATQSPRATIITGKIKANFPGRMAFKVAQRVESQTILDRSGANNLIGRGDMLFQGGSEITRVQCAFIDTPEIEAITSFISRQQAYPAPYELPLVQEDSIDATEGMISADGTSTFEKVARFVVNTQTGSTSKIQRTFSVGFNRAGRLMDQLEEAGIVGPQNGSKPREVLVQSEIELLNILQTLREQGRKFE